MQADKLLQDLENRLNGTMLLFIRRFTELEIGTCLSRLHETSAAFK